MWKDQVKCYRWHQLQISFYWIRNVTSQYLVQITTWPSLHVKSHVMSSLYRGGDVLLYFRPLICSSQISFVSVRSLCLSCRRSNTRRSPNAGLLLAHRLRRWANISPVLGYHVVFVATLNVGQHHRRRANITQPLFLIWIGLKIWRTNKRRQPDILAP